MSDDVKLCAKTRKVIVASGFDVSRVRVRVTRGLINLQGTAIRLGENKKEPDANTPFLERLDEDLQRLPDCRGVRYTFDNWRRESNGRWEYTGKKVRGGKKH